MADGGAPLSELRAYFRGIDFALALLKKRLAARPDLDRDSALAELERYHRVVRDNLAQLQAASARGTEATTDTGPATETNSN